MVNIRKRGRSFHVDFVMGEVRLRGSLATHNKEAARRVANKLETAISEGPSSAGWNELRTVLPMGTLSRFAQFVGAKETYQPTWNELDHSFNVHMGQRIKIGKLQNSTAERYRVTLREFQAFLSEQQITLLSEITKPVVEKFKVWRVERINKRKFSRGATSLALDAAILHRVFAHGVDAEMIAKNPVRMEGRPGENPQGGAEPFTAKALSLMRDKAAEDVIAFLLLRWTGLRGSDAVALTWAEIHFDRREIERITQKRRKKVILPIHPELLFVLETDFAERQPKPADRVLLNPTTRTPLTRPRLYHRILALGKRAGVVDAHPHRFRDTLAVDMLTRGASPYDVAKMLGDTIETVEKHYTPFVKELRERVRSILETGVGLEELAQKASERSQFPIKKPN